MVQLFPSRWNSLIIKSYVVIIAARHNAIGPTEIGVGTGSDATRVGILQDRSLSSSGSFKDAFCYVKQRLFMTGSASNPALPAEPRMRFGALAVLPLLQLSTSCKRLDGGGIATQDRSSNPH